jgi:cell division protein FtsL
MILFGVVPPATPPGQHARSGAVIAAGTLKREKEASPLSKALAKLSMRERVMIGTLAVLVIVALLAFFVALPAIDRIHALENEIVDLQEQKDAVHIEPDLTPQYQAIYDAALQDYNNYQRFYYSFMDPEAIDRTITDMLFDNNLHPTRLAMSSIESDLPSLYSAALTIVPRPVPDVEPQKTNTGDTGTGSGAGTGDGSQGGADGTGGTAADASGDSSGSSAGRTEQAAAAAERAGSDEGTTSTDSSGVVEGTSVYCYTIDIEAVGKMADLFTFLESAKGIVAMEIVSYSYSDPVEEATSTTGPTSPSEAEPEAGETVTVLRTTENLEGGTIVMQIKLYVFIGGDVTPSDAN